MSLAPDTTDLLARARADLRMGVPVVLGRETGLLILAVETLNPERLAGALALPGDLDLVITGRRAETLKARVGQDVKIKATVDESLIGGLVVKVGSKMIDTSVRAKLNALQNAMKEVG